MRSSPTISKNVSVPEPARPPRRLRWVVPVLGIAQIISWGSLYYPIAVLGTAIRRDLAISDIAVFGSFTAGLFVSGIAAPAAGKLVDTRGGRFTLSCGSALGVIALALLAVANSTVTLTAGFVVAGLAMAGCLYDPAFATLHAISGPSYRKAVTALTLFGGFASTVFWPLSQFLLDAYGWRTAFAVYAGLNLLICLPLHLWILPRGPGADVHASAAPDPAVAARPAQPDVFVWLATALALAAFLSSALSAHVIGLLTSSGLTARDAVLVSSLIGPMQVAGRVAEFAFSGHLRPLAVGTLAFGLLAAGLLVLTQVHGVWIVALAFALLYGWSNGVMTIVRGTVPGELFGHRRFGALLGRLAQPQFVARAIAPVALTLVFAIDPDRTLSLYALAVAGGIAFFAYRRALRASASAG
jgi:predicted MFS family arabinose efflux permease